MKETYTDNQAFAMREEIAKVLLGPATGKGVCPIKDVLSRYGDKWSMYTILFLGQKEKLRFTEIKSGVLGISQRMLTVTLRLLEEDGMVTRTVYPQIPPRVEYSLTSMGKSLVSQLLHLAGWASAHMDEIVKARKKYRKKSEKA
jgi:DNA-binding HxlR family transcriptional regulator